MKDLLNIIAEVFEFDSTEHFDNETAALLRTVTTGIGNGI